MRRVALRLILSLVTLSVVAAPAHAQRRRVRRAPAAAGGPELGAHLGYNFDVDDAVFGAQASFPIVPQLDFYPSFDYYTVSNATEWGLNFDLRVRAPAPRSWYFASGVNLLHVSVAGVSNTKTHFNLVLGFEGRQGQLHPYAEAREILGNGSAFQIAGGLSFPLR